MLGNSKISNKKDGVSKLPVASESSIGRSPAPSEVGDKPPSSTKSQDSERRTVPRHRFLSPAEWTILARGVGGIKDVEHNAPVHPPNWWWPPTGLPPGLYRDVVFNRVKSFYMFHIASVLRWGLMVTQLFLGASLTALGSLSMQNGTSITILAAANTIIAGMLALIHNSGLPDRYRYDMAEFEQVEDRIRELLDSRLIPADKGVDQALAECFHLYHGAKATVAANMPVTYTSRQALQAGRQNVPMADPAPVVAPKLSRSNNTEEKKVPVAKAG